MGQTGLGWESREESAVQSWTKSVTPIRYPSENDWEQLDIYDSVLQKKKYPN